MRSAVKNLRAAAALAAIAGLLAAPRPAAAGEYTIYACQADDAGYVSSAFEDFATRGMKWRRACNPLGPGLRGLVSANVPGTGRVARGAQSGFALDAPPGTMFSRLRWSGHAQRRDCRYALQLFAERPGASAVSIRNVRANHNCPRPDVAQASSWPRLRSYDLGGATRIVQRVVCVGAPSREFCSARGQNFIRTFAAEATVVDGIAPSVAVVQDSALAQGRWVNGRQRFNYEASDNVGVKSASALIAGGSRGDDPRSCDYSQRVPCPSGRGSIQVDTSEAPEGKINTTDPDAKRMKFGRNFIPAYNAQAVTTEGQIIIAAEITTEGVDFEQLDPMISAAERELQGAGLTERPEVVLADAGYWSNGHIDSLRKRGMTPIVAPDTTRNRPRKTRLGGPYDFMRRVLATESGGALYSQRQWMVEPVFAQIKANRRIERFKRRGRTAARSEWRLIAATHNLLKLYRHSLAAATA